MLQQNGKHLSAEQPKPENEKAKRQEKTGVEINNAPRHDSVFGCCFFWSHARKHHRCGKAAPLITRCLSASWLTSGSKLAADRARKVWIISPRLRSPLAQIAI
jgi:hypothetical protein